MLEAIHVVDNFEILVTNSSQCEVHFETLSPTSLVEYYMTYPPSRQIFKNNHLISSWNILESGSKYILNLRYVLIKLCYLCLSSNISNQYRQDDGKRHDVTSFEAIWIIWHYVTLGNTWLITDVDISLTHWQSIKTSKN